MGNISCCECLWCHKQTRKKYNALIAKYKKMDDAIPKIKDFNQKYLKCKAIVALIENEFNCNAQLLYRHCWDLCQSAMCIMNGEELMNNLIKTVKYNIGTRQRHSNSKRSQGI